MTQTTTTTTTTTTTSTQVNQQLTVGTSTSSYNLGSYVTDVSINPYMASTLIGFLAYNMRPNTLLHVFFNSILVDQYCCPGVINPNTSVDSASSSYILSTASYGSPIYSDQNGNVFGLFNVPDATFKTGSLALEICDVSSIILGNNAITTEAFATFDASNITVTKQSTTLTTINPIISVANVINQVVSVNAVSNTVVDPNNVIVNNKNVVAGTINIDPIAQLYQFGTPNEESGAFVTAIDLFFFQKSLTNPNNGVTVYIAETLNGYPDTSNILPFSTTHIFGSQINVSNNASVATNIQFESPVYVDADTYYAIIIIPDQSDPDILLWVANLGDVDVTTGTQVYSQPNAGVLYEGATTSGWTALQSQYLKFNVYRANFTTNSAVAYFNNTNRDHLAIYNIAYANSSYSIIPGDSVYSSTNNLVTTVNTSVNATAFYYNIANGVFDVSNTSGNFGNTSFIQVHRFANISNTNTPSNSTLIAYANVSGVVDVKMNTCVPRITSITPSGTQIQYSTNSMSNSYIIDSVAFPVNVDSSNELFDYERDILSKTNENSHIGGAKSLTINAFLTSDSSYLSPLIDTIRADTYAIQNLIDPLSYTLYNEMFTYGSAQTKYLSLPVTLATGQSAENIQVIIDAYKPYSSYIQVYTRFLNSEDSDTLSNKTWTPMISDGDDYYSNYANPTDYITLNYYVPGAYGAYQCNGTITVSNTSNIVTGNGTSFTTSLQVGWYLGLVGDDSQQIISIANNTSLQLANTFLFNWASNSFFLVPPPTTAWLSGNTNTQIAGTVSANTTSNIITGSGTNFLSVFSPGTIISFANDEQVVVSVTNNTSLSVGTSWTSVANSVNAQLVTLTGVNYLNANSNLYMNFNQFQIKVVLLSNDDSKVPIMKSCSAIALTS